MKFVLVQAREPSDAMLEHEVQCFADRLGIPRDALVLWNAVESPVSVDALPSDAVVLVGGSGDHTLTTVDALWKREFVAFTHAVVDADIPMFASCFGFHALIRAFGGDVVRDESRGEVGTFAVTLTQEGREDALFEGVGDAFDAQLGHNDSALVVPDGLICLARSERCPIQAVRVPGKSVIATQFHPELTERDNVIRFLSYLEKYRPEMSEEQARDYAASIHRPTPIANALLMRFIEDVR